MLLRTRQHVLGSAVVLFCILCYVFNLFLANISLETKGALSRADLAGIDRLTHASIPRLIHQVYLGWDNSSIPSAWQVQRQTFLHLHLDYEHQLWNYQSARNLLWTDFPWFLDTWDNYQYGVQKSDSIRYFILWKYGGIYVDLDNGCKHRLDPLLQFPAWLAKAPVNTPFVGIHLMGSVPRHPYFKLAVDSLQAYNVNWGFPHLTIYNSAGPHFATFIRHRYSRLGLDNSSPVRLLMPAEQQDNDWSFFTSGNGHSWERWDTKVLQELAKHPVLLIILAVLGLCCLSKAMWLGIRLCCRRINKLVYATRRRSEGVSPARILPKWWKENPEEVVAIKNRDC